MYFSFMILKQDMSLNSEMLDINYRLNEQKLKHYLHMMNPVVSGNVMKNAPLGVLVYKNT